MNPLQGKAHLFANGKFKVKIHYGKNSKPVLSLSHRTLPDVVNYPDHCTLIARPIEDLTDEERQGLTVPNNFKNKLKYYWFHLKHEMDTKDFLHLLSIGVYPFSQEDFRTGTVIDIRSLS